MGTLCDDSPRRQAIKGGQFFESFNMFRNINKIKLLKIVLILIYLFSPIDILPEAVLGPLGLIDDGAAIALLIKILLSK